MRYRVAVASLKVPHRLRQMASHARTLARTVPGDEAGKRLNDYAEELEARAQALDQGRA